LPRRRRQAYRTTVPLPFGLSVVFMLRLLVVVVGVEVVAFLLWISVSVSRLLLVGVRFMASAEQCVDIWF
jgi:hypothetical protein